MSVVDPAFAQNWNVAATSRLPPVEDSFWITAGTNLEVGEGDRDECRGVDEI